MKKILSYFFIVLGTVIMVASTSVPILKVIHDNRYFEVNKSAWGEHHNKGGDLVNMAYLDEVKKFQEPKALQFLPTEDTDVKNIDLYIYGDSYTEDIPGIVFANTNYYHYGRSSYGYLLYTLNPKKKNILILEVAERFARQHLVSANIFDKVKKNTEPSAMHAPELQDAKKVNYAFLGLPLNMDIFFNKNINQDLEYNLFNYNFLNKPRFLKADMNYYLFNRASGNVSLSEDGNYLFIKESIVPHGDYSYYEKISKETLDNLITGANTMYLHYKKEGFDQVYFAIIPNPATILQPAYYNQLLPLLQHNPSLLAPVIDIYSIFKNHTAPATLYRAGDTHWNNKGMQLWLKLVNDSLRAESKKAG